MQNNQLMYQKRLKVLKFWISSLFKILVFFVIKICLQNCDDDSDDDCDDDDDNDDDNQGFQYVFAQVGT